MDMADIARSMSARMPWPVGSRILNVEDLPRGHGWEKTVAGLSDQSVDFSGKIDAAAAALVEHYLCGEKLVRFYEIDAGSNPAIAQALEVATIPDGQFKDSYPAYLSEDELASASNDPTLVAIEKTESGTGLVFASARVIVKREPLDDADLPETLVDQYEEIYGVRQIRYQAMDIIWVPSHGKYVDVRVDYPKDMQRDTGGAAQTILQAKFHEIVGSGFLGTPINLFPLINKIYRAPKEGSIVELAFGTTTASIKHEKMRRKALCLRDETYHKGGKAALGTPIEPYRLSVVWKRPISAKRFSTPELSLNSSAMVSASVQPTMIDAVVRNCMGYDDFDFVKSRMEHYL
ncbi:hypothetical protein AB7828_10095 [Tardiphaga sp. 215_C5_N2_1]|uniref:hypothetical protein n=1 Tax=Tardiphaga sp. 215_C5_N2_1 TaxID=3240774 RepID=UPI003F8A94B4